MFTDMTGYTALGQRDESLSLALVEEQRKLLRPVFKRHGGREVKSMGDAFLVEFSNALEAVRCAYDAQRASREFNISRPREKRLALRIGLHLGDVVESEGDISGDAVNVASRIQSEPEGEGVCLTRQVYDHVQNKFELPLKSIGMRSLKNVRTPIEVYKMEMPWEGEQVHQTGQLVPNRIAVLPFTSFSPDPNDSYFADGITEEIISTLSGVSGLNVISRTSVMGYKGSTKKLKEIGNELEVGSVLEGSFRKAGRIIRVTAQLIAVRDEQHLWAQSYDRNLDDVFAVQSDIAMQVADALRVKILAPEIARIDRRPTESASAYSLYLRGRVHLNKRNLDDLKRAAEYFGQAIEEDAGFALGYVGLADCFELIGNNYGIDIAANHEKAKSTVAKALILDRDLAEAHATQGLLLYRDFNQREAEKEFRKSIELKPSYASANHWYFHLLGSQSRWDEALREIERAVQLDPLSQTIILNHSDYYFWRRDYDKALELNKKAVELDPSSANAHMYLIGSYGRMNMLDDLRREVIIAIGLVQEKFPHLPKLLHAWSAYYEGDKVRLKEQMPELEAHFGEMGNMDGIFIAAFHFYLDDNDRGFEWLERSFSRREYPLIHVKNLPYFDHVRADPRYHALLKKLGLE